MYTATPSLANDFIHEVDAMRGAAAMRGRLLAVQREDPDGAAAVAAREADSAAAAVRATKANERERLSMAQGTETGGVLLLGAPASAAAEHEREHAAAAPAAATPKGGGKGGGRGKSGGGGKRGGSGRGSSTGTPTESGGGIAAAAAASAVMKSNGGGATDACRSAVGAEAGASDNVPHASSRGSRKNRSAASSSGGGGGSNRSRAAGSKSGSGNAPPGAVKAPAALGLQQTASGKSVDASGGIKGRSGAKGEVAFPVGTRVKAKYLASKHGGLGTKYMQGVITAILKKLIDGRPVYEITYDEKTAAAEHVVEKEVKEQFIKLLK